MNITVEGKPLIVVAAEKGREKCLETLIQSGGNVNSYDHYRLTPLMNAPGMVTLDV